MSANRLLDAALRYVTERGWSVFPCDPGGKQPLGKLARHGVLDASADERQVQSWWREMPNANIAVRTGLPDTFDAQDFDTQAAMEWMVATAKQHDFDVTELPRFETGSGGRQTLWLTTGLGNRTSVIAGMDWRGKNGYSLVPPSIHPNGNPYRWIREPNGLLTPVPEWLMELMRKGKPERAQQPAQVGDQQTSRAYIKAAIEAELASLRSAREGQRNDQLNRSGFALGTMVGAGWLSKFRAESELRAAAYAVGLEEPEVSRTIRSGLEDGMSHPREPVPSDGGGEIITASAPQRHTAGTTSNDDDEITADELVRLELPPTKWAVEGIIPEGLTILAGRPKTGKSWLVLEMAIGVAGGKPVLQRIEVDGGVVLGLFLEDNKKRLKNRLVKLLGGKGAPRRLYLRTEWPRADQGGLDKLRVWLRNHPDTRLVIIDTLEKFRARSKNQQATYQADYEAGSGLSAVAREFEVAIVVLHHNRKLEADDWIDTISGTLGLSGSADALVGLFHKRGQNTAQLKVTGRDVEEADLGLLFHPVNGQWELIGSGADVLMSRARQEIRDFLRAKGASTPSTVASTLGKNLSTVRTLLQRMLEAGQVQVSESGHLYYVDAVDGVDAVSPVDTWTEQMTLSPSSTASTGDEELNSKSGCPLCRTPAFTVEKDGRHRCHRCGHVYEV